MFSSIKMEEYIESELSGIFRVKPVTKNIVRGSLGTHFMHMKVNLRLILQSPCAELLYFPVMLP